jgi:electron transport complex protein RnfE
LYLILGIFVPLIVTNCAILGRAEAFASKNTWGKSALDGLMMGLGFSTINPSPINAPGGRIASKVP